MQNNNSPWYIRYEKVAVWATLFFVVAGGMARYVLIDRPSASVQSAKDIDELVDTLRPNFQLSLTKWEWTNNGVNMDFMLTNAGARSILVSAPTWKLGVKNFPDDARKGQRLPTSEETAIQSCTPGLLTPGEKLRCVLSLDFGPHRDNVGVFTYSIEFSAITPVPRESKTWSLLKSEYPEAYFVERAKKQSSMTGSFSR